MNARVDSGRLAQPSLGDAARVQAATPSPSLRLNWQGRFGAMLIEVQEGQVYVNGTRVEPAPGRAPTPAC